MYMQKRAWRHTHTHRDACERHMGVHCREAWVQTTSPHTHFPNGNRCLQLNTSQLSENIKNMICYKAPFSPLRFLCARKIPH